MLAKQRKPITSAQQTESVASAPFAAEIPDSKTRALRRMKAIAFLALFVSLVLLVVSHLMGRQGVWGWIGAFSEAAAVGALADWFAVTALFRHPLGLPITHTAIIPRNQKRIAHTLAQFIQDKFLDKNMLMQRITAYNPAQKLGQMLSNLGYVRKITSQLQTWAISSLETMDVVAVEHQVYVVLQRQFKNWDSTSAFEQLFELLKSDQSQQSVLDTVLKKIAAKLASDEARIMFSEKMIATAREKYPNMIWLTDKLEYTDNIADTLVSHMTQSLLDEVQKVLLDPQHPLRMHYASEVQHFLYQVLHDPITRIKIKQQKKSMADHPALQFFTHTMVRILRDWVSSDLKKDDSQLATRLMLYVSVLGDRLQNNVTWQRTINQYIQTISWYAIDHMRKIVPGHIVTTMQSWDSEYLVNEIERNVGRDLQFIRINGTIIGGIVGVIFYAIVQFLG